MIILIMAAALSTEEAQIPSNDAFAKEAWASGFCQGFNMAADFSRSNATRFEERITTGGHTVVNQTVDLIKKGIELYVVVPRISTRLMLANGRVLDCSKD